MRGAILATAARTHWRHDLTGRAIPTPANDLSPQARPNPACHLTAAVSTPHLCCGGGLFFPHLHEVQNAE